MDFRKTLLDCHLKPLRSQELSEWLKDIGQDPKGKVEEKIARIRQHTEYLSMPTETFPGQTINYLNHYSADILAEICRALGLKEDGRKSALYRRIYREVGFREGWLQPISKGTTRAINKEIILPFINWYPILKNKNYEKDYYRDFHEEMSDIFGEENVHDQQTVAHGNTLKIDFHLGHPQQDGVGIEFKMPKGNSGIQKALGQIDQYKRRYGENLIVILIPDFLQNHQVILFVDELKHKGIETVVKTKA